MSLPYYSLLDVRLVGMLVEQAVCLILGREMYWVLPKRSLISQFSLIDAGWLFLVISSVTFFVYFIQPLTNLVQQQVGSQTQMTVASEMLKLDNKTAENCVNKCLQEIRMLKDNINKCREETTTIAALLEMGKVNLWQMNATLTAKIVLYAEELKQEKEHASRWVQTFKKEKDSLEGLVRTHEEFFDYASLVLRNHPYPGVANYTRYAVARLGLQPLANVEPIEPEFGPVINNVTRFDYSITIPPCQNVTANRSVFLAIISAPDNFDKRNIVRQTWAKHLKAEHDVGSLGIAGFAFISGRTESNGTQKRLEEESATYGDIIQIAMPDFYRNLALKVAGLFNWLHRNCAAVDFVLKVDDDVYVNARNLVHFVQSHHRSNRSMYGLSAGYFSANRVGKWNITYDEWPWKQYPPYYYGPAVIIPGSTIRPLLAAFQTTPVMPFDDVYYSGICTEKAGIKIHLSSNSFNVFVMRQPGVPDACDVRRVVAWLTVSANHMNNSHVATDDFYHNRTQCIVTDSLGTNSTIGYNEPVQFLFV